MSDTDKNDEPSSASASTPAPDSAPSSTPSADVSSDLPTASQTDSQPSPEPSPQPGAEAESEANAEAEAEAESEANAEVEADAKAEARDEPQPPAPSPSSSLPETPPTLAQARIFLRDPAVAREPPARKAAFLAAKGLSGSEIDLLLKEVADEAPQPEPASSEVSSTAAATAPSSASASASSPPATLPPIVTYPEFVANSSPQPPPPLVTPQVLAAALYGTAATSTLLYAAAKLVLAPMVDALTEARCELHETAGANLTALTEKLQGVVSVVPPLLSGAAAKKEDEAEIEVEIDDASSASSYDDPTEVFHRDIGVQTSLPPSPALRPAVTMDSTVPNPASGGRSSPSSSASASVTQPAPTASQLQADRLASLVGSVRALSQGWVGSTDLHAEIKTTVDMFRQDVDKLSRPPAFTYGGGGAGGLYSYGSAISGSGSSGTSGTKYPGYVTTTRNEPDDEIRKAKENIRRVKGALLSTRTFPTAR